MKMIQKLIEKRKLSYMLLIIAILSIFPVVYASTVNESVSDSFRFQEVFIIVQTSLPHVLLDKFHLQDGRPIITIGAQPGGNPLSNQSHTGQLVFVDTKSLLGNAITEFGVPIGFLMAVMIVAWKIGVMGIYIMLPILMFTLAGIGWIISGNWTTVIVMEVIFAASSLTLVMLKFLGMRGSGESEQ